MISGSAPAAPGAGAAGKAASTASADDAAITTFDETAQTAAG